MKRLITVGFLLALLGGAAQSQTIDALTAGAALGGTERFPMFQTANPAVYATAAQIKTFVSASPTLVTPVIGVATGTSLQLAAGGSSQPALFGNGTWFGTAIPFMTSATLNTGVAFDIMPNGTQASTWIDVLDTDVRTNGVTNYEAAHLQKNAAGSAVLQTTCAGTGVCRDLQLQPTATDSQRVTIGVDTSPKGKVTIVQGGAVAEANFGLSILAAQNDTALAFGSVAGSSGYGYIQAEIRASSFSGRPVYLQPAGGYAQIGQGPAPFSGETANTFRIGATASATPVAQTLGSQIASGTDTAAAATFIIQGPFATGAGTNGDLVFQTGVKVVSGSGAPTKTTGLRIAGETQLITLPAITSDATHTDAAVCEDTTTHALYSGSGTLGMCLGTSSVRYKRDVVALADGIEEILALAPVNYFYLTGHGDGGSRQQYGFLAEDVAKVLPELVGLDREGLPNSVDILGMVPIIVRALQVQQAQISRLERKTAWIDDLLPYSPVQSDIMPLQQQ